MMRISPFKPGQQIDDYILREEIASGGMGEVWLAFQESMNRLVAIKFLPEVDKDNSDTVARFDREIHMISHLEHPHIVPVYGFGDYHGNPFIIMRHMNGGTLRDYFQDGKLNLRRIMAVVDQIVTAIDYAHSQDIIHRDIKPSNIFLDERENAYLADFGLAKTVSGSYDLTRTDEGISGTPEYMSPEQVRGLRLDGRTDIYSVGVIVFQLMSGHPPFSGQNPMDTVLKQISDPVPSIRSYQPDLPPDIDRVFNRVLSKDVSERYETGRDFYNDLESVLSDFEPSWIPAKVSGIVSTEPITLPNQETDGSDERTVRNFKKSGDSKENQAEPEKKESDDTTIYDDVIVIPPLSPFAKRLIIGLIAGAIIIGGIAFGINRLLSIINDPLANVVGSPVTNIGSPRDLVIEEDGPIWAINSTDEEIFKLRTDCAIDPTLCGSIIGQYSGGSRPQFLTLAPDRLLVGRQFDPGLISIPLDGSPATEIEFDYIPADALVDGSTLWITSDEDLIEMDLNGAEIASYTAGPGAASLYKIDRGLWVALDGSSSIRRFNLDTKQFDPEISLSTLKGQVISMAGLDADNRLWVTLNRDNLLIQLDAVSGEIVGDVSTGDLPLDIAIYQDLVFVVARGSNQINVFNAKQGSFLSSITTIENPSSLVIQPCGSDCAKLWVASEVEDLVFEVVLDPLP